MKIHSTRFGTKKEDKGKEGEEGREEGREREHGREGGRETEKIASEISIFKESYLGGVKPRRVSDVLVIIIIAGCKT